MPDSGVLNVNTAKSRAITQSRKNAPFGCLHAAVLLLSLRVSKTYAIAAQIKKMAIFNQSGDLPITPL